MKDRTAQRDEAEFPQGMWDQAGVYANDGPSRRRFLQVMGASMALAGLGLSGCKRAEHHLLAYGDAPAEAVEGKPLYFATTYVLAGEPIGVLAETHTGRPTKIEGNPRHPNSLGATDIFAQASVLELYDPNRSRAFVKGGNPANKDSFLAELDEQLAKLKETNGAGLAILSEDFASPAVQMLRKELGRKLPGARFYVYEPVARSGALLDLSAADVIVTLDCDLLGTEDRGIRYRRQFAQRRKVDDTGTMNRLYVVEPGFTATGLAADHRLRLGAAHIGALAQALLAALGGGTFAAPPGVEPAWIQAVAEDLLAHRGHALVVVGDRQPAQVRQYADAINRVLGSKLPNQVAPGAGQAPGLGALAGAIGQQQVRTLLILGGNPAYNAPSELAFADAIKSIPWSARLGLHEDETSALCTWHVPALHYLESWGDARSADGTYSPIQPMIEPLFGGMGHLELLARVGGYETTVPYEIARRSFAQFAGGTDEGKWRTFLHEGALKGEPAAYIAPATELAAFPAPPALSASSLELCFATDPAIYDGRFANNGWLQECPDIITQLTWDNAALLSPRTARELGVELGDVVKLEVDGRSIEIAAMPVPGLADYSITLPLGYGRRRGGALAEKMGFDVYPLRISAGMGFVVGATLSRTGRKYPLATTQEHWTIGEHATVDDQVTRRGIAREGTLEEYQKRPAFVRHMGVEKPTSLPIYTPPELTGKNQWGMAIDLNACIGCNACVVACQSENNVPIVGKDEVIRGREMHWLRMDRYFHGADPEGEVTAAIEPMLCQHCELAPCEPVCPVNATVHDSEGLNAMVYNRCIGTRYCSNNCPYKVRRFNFFDYNKGTIYESGRAPFDGDSEPDPLHGFSQLQLFQPPMQELLKMQKNPDVTVRMRGVMEKCTFCVQRIKRAEVDTKVAAGQGEPGLTTDVVTACQQVCPTQAIVFGNLSDPESAVVRMKQSDRNYAELDHLNVKPRTTYLARIRNLNPKLAPATGESTGHQEVPA